MRLPLSALPAALALACGGQATHSPGARVHVYEDPRLTVVTPSVREEIEVDRSRAFADYAVDLVSGATQALTVDAVSAATRFEEARQQLSVGVAHPLTERTEARATYGVSLEGDHLAQAPSFGLAREVGDGMAKVSGRYQVVVERIGRADDPSYEASALGHRIDLAWSAIATRELTWAALATASGHTCDERPGCFANPYRWVGVHGTPGGILAVPETHPGRRLTLAGALRLAWAPTPTSALGGGYRWAGDDWGLVAHTVDASGALESPGLGWLLRADARATLQGAADFQRERYVADATSLPRYRTADAELAALWTVRVQVHLGWRLGWARPALQLGRMWSRYDSFAGPAARDAWLAGAGLDGTL
ncbi:MAG: DUF3570 domain-containing protein [Polyangiaceae bacterium]|nr:DUF3570 domain-containing protein [Polyangiaceae bacterium]